ncbi:MAG: VWA domain-containing protein [Planctomycetota bacterium]
MVFVLDTSMSMKGQKIESLKQTMSDTLERMPEHMAFNVVNFGGTVHVMRPSALIDARHRATADDSIRYMELSWGTRTFDALEEATRLPGMDTIVYLSDAAPVAGAFEAWDRIVGVFDLYNRYRPVAIDCILYGKGKRGRKRKGRAGGMARLAEHNVGVLSIADQAGQVQRQP